MTIVDDIDQSIRNRKLAEGLASIAILIGAVVLAYFCYTGVSINGSVLIP